MLQKWSKNINEIELRTFYRKTIKKKVVVKKIYKRLCIENVKAIEILSQIKYSLFLPQRMIEKTDFPHRLKPV